MFSVATHIVPLPGADTACLGFWHAHTHHGSSILPPLVWSHINSCSCRHWSPAMHHVDEGWPRICLTAFIPTLVNWYWWWWWWCCWLPYLTLVFPYCYTDEAEEGGKNDATNRMLNGLYHLGGLFPRNMTAYIQ